MRRIVGATVALAVLTMTPLGAGNPVRAEDEKPQGWSDTAEFSYVFTAGNSESSTLGFKNKLSREWEKSLFTLKAGAIRVESTPAVSEAFAADPLDLTTYTFVKPASETTAENYFLNGRYDRKITDAFFWYTGVGWDRNEFAGIKNRYMAIGGVGNIWFDGEEMKFKTDYALTFTDQEDVVEIAGVDDTFLGARFSWDYWHKFGENTEYVNTLVLDANLDESDDWRADMINSVAVAMNKRMALKLSLQWLYDNQPSFSLLPLLAPDPADPTRIVDTGEVVPYELDELDTVFTASLVVNF